MLLVMLRPHENVAVVSASEIVIFAEALLGFALVGAILTLRGPTMPFGLYFSATTFLGTLFLSRNLFVHFHYVGTIPKVVNDGLLSVSFALSWIPILLPAIFGTLRFPDGRLPTIHSGWKISSRASALGLVLLFLSSTFSPGGLRGVPNGITNPLGAEASAGLLPILGTMAWALIAIGLLAGGLSIVIRFIRRRPGERQQLKWLVYPGTVFAGLLVTVWLEVGLIGLYRWPLLLDISVAALGLSLSLIPICAGVGISRYEKLRQLGGVSQR